MPTRRGRRCAGDLKERSYNSLPGFQKKIFCISGKAFRIAVNGTSILPASSVIFCILNRSEFLLHLFKTTPSSPPKRAPGTTSTVPVGKHAKKILIAEDKTINPKFIRAYGKANLIKEHFIEFSKVILLQPSHSPTIKAEPVRPHPA